jgi:predicted ATPase
MLERIYADNFRCLTNFEVRLAPSQLLIGANGCGKTTLWEILASLQDVVARGASVEDTFSPPTRTRWDPRETQTFELDAAAEGESFRYRLEIEHASAAVRDRPSVRIQAEELKAGGTCLYRRSPDGMVELFGDTPSTEPRARIPFDERRSFLPSLQARPENRRLRAFRDLVDRMHLVSIAPLGFEATSMGESPRLARDARNFGSWLLSRHADDTTLVARLGEDLKSCIAGFQRLRFERVTATARELMVEVKPENVVKPVALGVRELSDGERVLLVLYALLHGTEPGTFLFLDEPDNFVALRELQPWLVQLLEAVRSRDAQVIVASHNPETIDYLSAEATVVLSRPGGGPARVGGLDFDRESGMTASHWLAGGGPET